MEFNSTFVRVAILTLAIQVIAVGKQNISRWLIRWHFPAGVKISQWWSLNFVFGLTLGQIITLGVIASFTLLTFPIGVAISSVVAGKAFPAMRLVQVGSYMIALPINFYTMAYRLQELPVNKNTVLGLVIMEIAYFFVLLGAWFMFRGSIEDVI